MAGAYRTDGQLNIPTQAAADEMEFQNKFNMSRFNVPSGEMAFENSMTPTRDKFVGYLEEKLPTGKFGNLLGGQGQGFLDMGLADVIVAPSVLDSYDAYNRLEETKRTDDFSNTTDLAMARLPFSLKVAAVLDPNTNAIKDYYDGKKMDIVTMYAPMLGVAGVSILSKFGRAAANAPVIGKFVNKMLPMIQEEKTGALPSSFDMLPEATAKNPDAAIKGDRFTNLFVKSRDAFKEGIARQDPKFEYDE
tara:strand:- start:262 stop:1005 length:744 start_codon:yes stop_codon:yes gene_type:complete